MMTILRNFLCAGTFAVVVSLAMQLPAIATDKRTPAPELGKMEGREAEAFYLRIDLDQVIMYSGIQAYLRKAARSHNREVEHVSPYSHSNRWV